VSEFYEDLRWEYHRSGISVECQEFCTMIKSTSEFQPGAIQYPKTTPPVHLRSAGTCSTTLHREYHSQIFIYP